MPWSCTASGKREGEEEKQRGWAEKQKNVAFAGVSSAEMEQEQHDSADEALTSSSLWSQGSLARTDHVSQAY